MTTITATAVTAATRRRWIENALRALREGSYAELRNVRCHFEEGQLVLQGIVSSFYLKQVAQALVCRSSDPACHVDNRLEIWRQSDAWR